MTEDNRPFSPRNNAFAVIRATFGFVPDKVTTEQCVELMLAFAHYESARAEKALEIATGVNPLYFKAPAKEEV